MAHRSAGRLRFSQHPAPGSDHHRTGADPARACGRLADRQPRRTLQAIHPRPGRSRLRHRQRPGLQVSGSGQALARLSPQRRLRRGRAVLQQGLPGGQGREGTGRSERDPALHPGSRKDRRRGLPRSAAALRRGTVRQGPGRAAAFLRSGLGAETQSPAGLRGLLRRCAGGSGLPFRQAERRHRQEKAALLRRRDPGRGGPQTRLARQDVALRQRRRGGPERADLH